MIHRSALTFYWEHLHSFIYLWILLDRAIDQSYSWPLDRASTQVRLLRGLRRSAILCLEHSTNLCIERFRQHRVHCWRLWIMCLIHVSAYSAATSGLKLRLAGRTCCTSHSCFFYNKHCGLFYRLNDCIAGSWWRPRIIRIVFSWQRLLCHIVTLAEFATKVYWRFLCYRYIYIFIV